MRFGQLARSSESRTISSYRVFARRHGFEMPRTHAVSGARRVAWSLIHSIMIEVVVLWDLTTVQFVRYALGASILSMQPEETV